MFYLMLEAHKGFRIGVVLGSTSNISEWIPALCARVVDILLTPRVGVPVLLCLWIRDRGCPLGFNRIATIV